MNELKTQLVSNDKPILDRIQKSLKLLYKETPSLFIKNNQIGICERCLVFRFAYYIQEEFSEYFVDCDYNSNYFLCIDRGKDRITETSAKQIKNKDGTFTNRFIDIIIHKRTSNLNDNFVCFEIKKWNNHNSKAYQKDINNLEVLTGSEFKYKWGFYIILGKTMEKTRIIIFRNGKEIKIVEESLK